LNDRSFFNYRRLEDARAAYQKVLELDPQNATAYGFLGIVYHLMGNLDKAIVKYHEVRKSIDTGLQKLTGYCLLGTQC